MDYILGIDYYSHLITQSPFPPHSEFVVEACSDSRSNEEEEVCTVCGEELRMYVQDTTEILVAHKAESLCTPGGVLTSQVRLHVGDWYWITEVVIYGKG